MESLTIQMNGRTIVSLLKLSDFYCKIMQTVSNCIDQRIVIRYVHSSSTSACTPVCLLRNEIIKLLLLLSVISFASIPKEILSIHSVRITLGIKHQQHAPLLTYFWHIHNLKQVIYENTKENNCIDNVFTTIETYQSVGQNPLLSDYSGICFTYEER